KPPRGRHASWAGLRTSTIRSGFQQERHCKANLELYASYELMTIECASACRSSHRKRVQFGARKSRASGTVGGHDGTKSLSIGRLYSASRRRGRTFFNLETAGSRLQTER